MSSINKQETEVRGLVARDKLEDAAKHLEQVLAAFAGDLRDEVLALRAELTRVNREHRRRQISHNDYSAARTRLSFTLLEILDMAKKEAATNSPVTVFLSYNHSDSSVAQALKNGLETHGLSILIDSESIDPGDNIRAFIGKSIRNSDATICLVSEASLMSGWVALETVLALADVEVNERRRFIACYLDESFLAAGFQSTATASIDAKVSELDALRLKHIELGTLAPSLDEERERLLDLRHNLGRIIQRLRGSVSLDVRPEAIDASIEGLAASLTGPEP
jgi:hypothetical protein